jgi:RimJ/RimL family protein N-acetyltransferase
MEALFETERLTVRRMQQTDADFIFRLFNSPTWLQFLGDRNIRTLEEAGSYLRNVYLRGYADNGFGAWLVARKEGGEAIGLCGLFKRPYLAIPDLGYSLLPEFEGMGYAYEAASGTLSYASNEFARKSLLAIVSEKNTRSVHLLEKLGFLFKEQILPPDEERTLRLYGIILPRCR